MHQKQGALSSSLRSPERADFSGTWSSSDFGFLQIRVFLVTLVRTFVVHPVLADSKFRR